MPHGLRHGIVGMHLNRQVSAGVYYFYQQGEPRPVTAHNTFTQQLFAVSGNEHIEAYTFVGSVGHHRDIIRHIAHFPAFAYRSIVRNLYRAVFERRYAVSTPNRMFIYG